MITKKEDDYIDRRVTNLRVRDEMLNFKLREKLENRQHTILQGIDLINQGYPENDNNEYLNEYYLISSMIHDLNDWKFVERV